MISPKSLLLGLALVLPLHAQLDPRLQGSQTDFLDLYQQARIRVKPEIVSIFDFSGSMQCLMYHPRYCNTYSDDNGDITGITFQLSGGPDNYSVQITVGNPGWNGQKGYRATHTKDNEALIRPDGTAVTEDQVNATSSSAPVLWGDKSLNGAGSQACDVRNWVRCASHVRLKKDMGGGRIRTIDLPIPWKVMDARSSGYPLSSMMIKDQWTGPDANGTIRTFGSTEEIEVDTRYKVQEFPAGTAQQTIDNNQVLSGPKDQVVTKTKYMLRLSEFYLDWLFAGKYQDAADSRPDFSTSLSGKYIVFDAADMTNVGLQTDIQQGRGFGSAFTSDAQRALVLPARDRVQAVKEAAIRTWIAYQTRVFWAYRFLDDAEAGNDGKGNATATVVDPDSSRDKNAADATAQWVNGQDTGWTVFNSDSVAAMKRLAALFPYTNTPLCYATARTLAQYSSGNNIFNNVETDNDAPVPCQKHFLILFTDGVPTVDHDSQNYGDSPYFSDATKGKAADGNAALIRNRSQIDPGGPWWNIFTLAGAAAHLADDTKASYTLDALIPNDADHVMPPPTAYPTSASAPNRFLPFAIPQRGSLAYSGTHRLVTTMTIGVSLGGTVSDTKSPKHRLFAAAAVGDPDRTSWDLGSLTPYTLKDPDDPEKGKTQASTYFFDATDPVLLTQALDSAFREATSGANPGVSSAASLPYVGASVGNQIYVGRFKPPTGGGVLWSGDLLMFPTRTDSNGGTVVLDKTGKATTDLTQANAAWSASANMPAWSARKLLTRIPGATDLSAFTYQGDAYDDGTKGLKNYVAADNPTDYPVGSEAQKNLIKKMMGAANPSNATKNRPDILGDIIGSSPSYLEYDTATLPIPVDGNKRFRLILAGTNQGWLHAFGETSSSTLIDDQNSTESPKPKFPLASGSVQELWAFMPTDFLKGLDYLNTPGNRHVFMVDGSPSIYFLDIPPRGHVTGNGKLDGAKEALNATKSERAIAIIGLRKGGRSYYALNLHNPTAPTLQWSLVPDEADGITDDRNETGLRLDKLQAIVKNMGYATCTPSFGRILFTKEGRKLYRDAVFLGGGLSLPEIEQKFRATDQDPPPLMGRSVLALDVNNGHFLAAVDLTTSANNARDTMVGPVPAGLVPFEFFLGSGMAQRAYFLDLWGGLWSWGSRAVVSADSTGPYRSFRKDSSLLQDWTGVRKVYQDEHAKGTASGSPPVCAFTGPCYTTLPAPFLVGAFPGKGKVDASGRRTAAPAAVGIAMVSGNRNDPLDYGSNLATGRLTVVFDRQDSRAWGLDAETGPDAGICKDDKLLQAGAWGAHASSTAVTDGVITPGNAAYYLAPSNDEPKYGYYVSFPEASGGHYPKGINPPLVAANSLYYACFSPTEADKCSGGAGTTSSYRICDVVNPVVASAADADVSCKGGLVDTWYNVASDFTLTAKGGAQQAGTRKGDSSDPSRIRTDTNSYLGMLRNRFPRARVWRTVQ